MKKFYGFIITLFLIAAGVGASYVVIDRFFSVDFTKVEKTDFKKNSDNTAAAKSEAKKIGEQYIEKARKNTKYQTDVVILDDNGNPSSALLLGNGDDNLQIYIENKNLKQDVKDAEALWNKNIGANTVKIVSKVKDADVIIEKEGDDSKLELPFSKGGITYFLKKGDYGTNNYIVIDDNFSGTTANSKTVVAHEIGHALGLAHREPNNTDQAYRDNSYDLMNTIVTDLTPYKLSTYDQLALRAAQQFWPLTYEKYLK